MIVYFQIMVQFSKLLQQKIQVLYQRNQDIVFNRKHNIFNPFCLIFSLQITRNSSYMLENSHIVTKCHMCQNFSDSQIASHILAQMYFCFLFSVPIRRLIFLFFFQFNSFTVLFNFKLFHVLVSFQFSFQFNSFNSSFSLFMHNIGLRLDFKHNIDLSFVPG